MGTPAVFVFLPIKLILMMEMISKGLLYDFKRLAEISAGIR
jgi:hypothetical protein